MIAWAEGAVSPTEVLERAHFGASVLTTHVHTHARTAKGHTEASRGDGRVVTWLWDGFAVYDACKLIDWCRWNPSSRAGVGDTAVKL